MTFFVVVIAAVVAFLVVVGFIADVVVNSFYNMAKKQDKIKWWITLGTAFRWAIDPFVFLFLMNLYVPIDIVPLYLPIFLLITPLVIGEGAVTGYIAYKIYNRVNKIS